MDLILSPKDGSAVSVVNSAVVKESTRQYDDCRDSLPVAVCYILLTNNGVSRHYHDSPKERESILVGIFRVLPQDGPVQNDCRGALLEFLAPYCKATCNECCGDANLPYPLCETIVSLPY